MAERQIQSKGSGLHLAVVPLERWPKSRCVWHSASTSWRSPGRICPFARSCTSLIMVGFLQKLGSFSTQELEAATAGWLHGVSFHLLNGNPEHHLSLMLKQLVHLYQAVAQTHQAPRSRDWTSGSNKQASKLSYRTGAQIRFRNTDLHRNWEKFKHL